MRYFFYNSFTLGSGYRYAELKDNEVTSVEMPVDIDCDFCNGGCQLVIRKTKSDTVVLIVKGILYVNDQKRFDEQGRKVYINFAVEASGKEHSILNNVFFSMIAEWDNLSRYLGEIIKIPFPTGIYGYGVEQECIESLIRFLAVYDSSLIQKELGIDRKNLNAIVLKSSDYSYYESLAKDLYKSKKQSFSNCFIPANTITGDTFSSVKMKYSVYSYEDFVRMINGGAANCSETLEEPGLEEGSQGREEPEQVTPALKSMQIAPCESNDDIKTDTVIDVSLNSHKTVSERICCKADRLVKSYYGFILGFACGLLVGYLIGKY